MDYGHTVTKHCILDWLRAENGGIVSAHNSSIFVPGDDVQAQLEQLRLRSPEMYRCIDPARVELWQGELAKNGFGKDDFDSDAANGRGSSYVRAQMLNMEARAHGIRQLMEMMRQGPAARRTIVDLLGGNGLVRQVWARFGIPDVEVMTCDASPHMVRAAWAAGIPALLQRAEQQLFRSGSVDGVLLAYGTHHIAPEDRSVVVEEAYRVLRPGGTFLLHDFMIGSPMDVWFATVVDPYSKTGHRYEHFTKDEISQYLIKAGFVSYEVREIGDPYTATGRTPCEAELSLGEYLVNMYGLCGAREAFGHEGAFAWAIERAKDIFRYPGGLEASMEYLESQQMWRLTLPRLAIVGVGRKS